LYESEESEQVSEYVKSTTQLEANLKKQVDIITKGILAKYEKVVESNITMTEERLDINSHMIESNIKLMTAN